MYELDTSFFKYYTDFISELAFVQDFVSVLNNTRLEDKIV